MSRKYHTEPERRGWDSDTSSQGITRIGVICHENGHFLGLPDLYDYGGDSAGVGNFCLMAGGSWNGNYGTQPTHMSAWCKKFLAWLTPTTVTTYGTYSVPCVETNKTVYLLSGAFPSTQYFLVENRQGVGFDTSMPGSTRGLLIWHIDETIGNNDNPAHYMVDLEEASVTQDLEQNLNTGDDADYFRFGGKTNFNYTTTPNSRSYTGVALGLDISAVSASSATMTFTIPQPFTLPVITTQPLAQTIMVGGSATFVLGVSGAPRLFYQWRLNGSNISTATNASYGIVNAQSNQAGQYSVVVTNAYGTATSSNALLTVQNALDHFLWAAIRNPQTSGVPFNVAISARDLSGTLLTAWTNKVFLSGAGNTGVVNLQPTNSGTFVSGQWTGSVLIVKADNNMRLTASDGLGHTGTSSVFNVMSGPLHHFTWGAVASTQVVAQSFPVTITAQDSLSNTCATFAGPVILSGFAPSSTLFLDDVEGGTNGWTHSGVNDLWHISTNRCSSSTHAWYCEADDTSSYLNFMDCSLVSTTLVLSAGARLSFQHWYALEQNYDKGYVELSTNNWASISTLATFTGSGNSWRGQTYDLSAYTGQLIKIRFRFSSDQSITSIGWFIDDIRIVPSSGLAAISISPTNSENFVNGVWNGAVSVPQAATNVFLKAYNVQGISGTSSLFHVVQSMKTSRGTPYLWLDNYSLATNANYTAAELTDTDKDGYTAWEEYVADTNPTNAASCFRIVAVSNLPPWRVYFEGSSTGRLYTIHWTTNLTSAAWTNDPSQLPVWGHGGIDALTDTNTTVKTRFYRLEVARP